ncbi:sugar phosphate isomerase/epimerase family protein [Cohnella sp. GCM10020058]|uniref:sugar phosphate isomerase/epimerase family protein n=1 Tax=Cohnella sp. GCM10020058 TaxID=3317330 RepID=UPI003635F1FB
MRYAAFSGPLMEYSIHEAMAIVAGLGFDGIEIAGREPHLGPDTSLKRVDEMRRVADGLGLAIPVLAGYMGAFSESSDAECEASCQAFSALLERAGRLGADAVRLFQGGPSAFLAQDYHYEKTAFWLRRCADEARRQDKRILLEIHNNSLIETIDGAQRLLALVGDSRVGLIHDAGNMYITGEDFGRESVRRLGDAIRHVHVKDEKRIPLADMPGSFRNRTVRGEEHFLQCRLGEGEVDHRELFAALQAADYGGWIALECFAPYPPEEQLGHDLAVVRSWWREGERMHG